MSLFGDIVSGILGYKDSKRAIKRQRNFMDEMLGRYTDAGQEARDDSQFRPFSVTSSIGGADATAEGGFNINLSPQQQALQDRLFAASGMFLDQLEGDPFAKAGKLYEQLRAIQRPEEEQRQLALEGRLRGQGRQGLRTSMFGGTPEQLALDLARERARNEALFRSYGQARRDQVQDFGLVQGLLGAGDSRNKQIQDLIRLGLAGSEIAQRGQLAGAKNNLMATLGGLGFYGNQGLNLLDMQSEKDSARSGFFNNLFGNLETAFANAAMAGSGGSTGGNLSSGGGF